MKTKFLYLLIIVFAVSLTSCKKRKAEKGLIGTWDVTTGESWGFTTGTGEYVMGGETGIFYLDKSCDGYLTILNQFNEIKHDIQINKLNIHNHRNDALVRQTGWHIYTGQFDSKTEKAIDFELSDADDSQGEKITKESTVLKMKIDLKNENITLIMVRQ